MIKHHSVTAPHEVGRLYCSPISCVNLFIFLTDSINLALQPFRSRLFLTAEQFFFDQFTEQMTGELSQLQQPWHGIGGQVNTDI